MKTVKLFLKDIPTVPEDMFNDKSGGYHLVPHPYTYDTKKEGWLLKKGWTIKGKSSIVEYKKEYKQHLIKVLFEDEKGEDYYFHQDKDHAKHFPYIIIKEK